MKHFEFIKEVEEQTEYVVVADFHLHHTPEWHKDLCWSIIRELVQLSCEGFYNRKLVLLGDGIETNKTVHPEVISMVLFLAANWNGPIFWVTGQHDTYLPNKGVFKSLEELDNYLITVIDEEPLVEKNVAFVPFCRDLDKYRGMISDVKKLSNRKKFPLLFTHMPTKEILESFGAKEPHAISVSEFAGFKTVVSGDIHIAHDIENLFYVGAPKQLNWKDFGVVPYIGLVDESSNFSRSQVWDTVTHLKITEDSRARDVLDLKTSVILKVDDSVTGELVEMLRAEDFVISCDLQPSNLSASIDEAIEVIEVDVEETIRKYVEESGVDKNRTDELTDHGIVLYNESLQA